MSLFCLLVSSMPPPPPSLSTMSEDELRELEQEGRRGLEARLQCLQNIHTLLDAAMLNIHHYLTTVATLRYTITLCWHTNKIYTPTPEVFISCILLIILFFPMLFTSPPQAESSTSEASGLDKTEAHSQENGIQISKINH